MPADHSLSLCCSSKESHQFRIDYFFCRRRLQHLIRDMIQRRNFLGNTNAGIHIALKCLYRHAMLKDDCSKLYDTVLIRIQARCLCIKSYESIYQACPGLRSHPAEHEQPMPIHIRFSQPFSYPSCRTIPFYCHVFQTSGT